MKYTFIEVDNNLQISITFACSKYIRSLLLFYVILKKNIYTYLIQILKKYWHKYPQYTSFDSMIVKFIWLLAHLRKVGGYASEFSVQLNMYGIWQLIPVFQLYIKVRTIQEYYRNYYWNLFYMNRTQLQNFLYESDIFRVILC